MAQTAEPNAAEKTAVARRRGPAGINVPVASATSFPFFAASAAPRNATQSVRSWTNGIDPGMPPAIRGRTTISASGSVTMAASATAAAKLLDGVKDAKGAAPETGQPGLWKLARGH